MSSFLDTILLAVFDHMNVHRECNVWYVASWGMIILSGGVGGFFWGTASPLMRSTMIVAGTASVLFGILAGYGMIRFTPGELSQLHAVAGAFVLYVIVGGLFMFSVMFAHHYRVHRENTKIIRRKLGF